MTEQSPQAVECLPVVAYQHRKKGKSWGPAVVADFIMEGFERRELTPHAPAQAIIDRLVRERDEARADAADMRSRWTHCEKRYAVAKSGREFREAEAQGSADDALLKDLVTIAKHHLGAASYARYFGGDSQGWQVMSFEGAHGGSTVYAKAPGLREAIEQAAQGIRSLTTTPKGEQ